MQKIINHQRLLFLHLLGITIPEPYGELYTKALELLKVENFIFLTDRVGRRNKCAINNNDKIIYSVFKDFNISKLRLNLNVEFFNIYNSKIVPVVDESEIVDIVDCVLRHNGVKFDNLTFSGFMSKTLIAHFENLKDEYKKMKVSKNFEYYKF